MMPKNQVSGLIPERCKEVNIRIYTRDQHLTYRVQHGFRQLLAKINLRLQDLPLLEAESLELIPDSQTLINTAKIAEQGPISDSSQNPFLNSPTMKTSPAKSRNSSPMRRLLETNAGVSIPNSALNARMKQARDEENITKEKKRMRKSYPLI